MKAFLFAFGDASSPLPETVRVLDEIITDYIIETCQIAARAAEYSGRQKIKTEDFKFAIRRDDLASGRVNDLLSTEKEIRKARKQFDDTEGKKGLERGGRKRKADDFLGEDEEEWKGRGGKRGKRGKRESEGVEEEEGGEGDVGEEDLEGEV